MSVKRYVRPASSSKGWDVVEDGHRRGSVRDQTKAGAITKARRMVREQGGGEVRVLNRQGKVTEAKTVDAGKPRSNRSGRTKNRSAS